MAQMNVKANRTYGKPKVVISYNEQDDKYYGILEDEGPNNPSIQFELSAATLQALKADLNAHADIEVS